MNISEIIRYKYGDVDFTSDVILQNWGDGVEIGEWNLSAPEPSISELEDIADTQEFKDWKERQDKKRKKEQAIRANPLGTYYAQVADKDASRSDKKYLQIEKTINGTTITEWAYVTDSVLQAHQRGDLEIGDYVIVDFADGDLDKPVVTDRVVGF
jgi:hypothetical protein